MTRLPDEMFSEWRGVRPSRAVRGPLSLCSGREFGAPSGESVEKEGEGHLAPSRVN